MLLSAYPHFHLAHLRIFGVLTRIAICYLFAGLICLAVWNTRHRVRNLAAITAALLIGYWALMRFVPVPGLGVPTRDFPSLDPVNNLAAWLDRGFNAFTRTWLHTGSLYNKTHDPEGLLSTLPATATTLIGCLTGPRGCKGCPMITAKRYRGVSLYRAAQLLSKETRHPDQTLSERSESKGSGGTPASCRRLPQRISTTRCLFVPI